MASDFLFVRIGKRPVQVFKSGVVMFESTLGDSSLLFVRDVRHLDPLIRGKLSDHAIVKTSHDFVATLCAGFDDQLIQRRILRVPHLKKDVPESRPLIRLELAGDNDLSERESVLVDFQVRTSSRPGGLAEEHVEDPL